MKIISLLSLCLLLSNFFSWTRFSFAVLVGLELATNITLVLKLKTRLPQVPNAGIIDVGHILNASSLLSIFLRVWMGDTGKSSMISRFKCI